VKFFCYSYHLLLIVQSLKIIKKCSLGGGKKANVELFLELAEEKNYDRDYAGKLLQSWDLGLKLGCVFLKTSHDHLKETIGDISSPFMLR
jgi:hypothetical protein